MQYFTNVSHASNSTQVSGGNNNNGAGNNGSNKKIVLLKLPVTIQVNKLVYGIMLGVQVSSKQILYYDKLQLYEKEQTHI